MAGCTAEAVLHKSVTDTRFTGRERGRQDTLIELGDYSPGAQLCLDSLSLAYIHTIGTREPVSDDRIVHTQWSDQTY